MNYPLKKEGKFHYVETNPDGEVLLLLHGLFGALSNFSSIVNHFSPRYNIVIPVLPIMELPIFEVSITGLLKHVEEFVEYKNFDQVNVLGNSLGGHISLLYSIANPEKIKSITLTGSSGLFENSLGSTFPKRGDYDFIREKTENVFYNPEVATKALVDEVYDTVNDRNKGIRIIKTAKSAVRHNLGDKLHHIKAPTLLIWGKEDSVTPAFVAKQFHELIENSTLHFIEECGHAPMMEKPELFNAYLDSFLNELKPSQVA